MFEGSVDQVTPTKATGWLYDREAGRTADVLALLHGRIIGSAPSTLHRPDLEEVGFGDGICGFDLPFDEPVKDWDIPFVNVKPRGSNLSIPRTSEDSYKDLVGLVTQLHPSSGRSRTVLGGLWTDRTDSLQILAGRVNTGGFHTAAKDTLRQFIAEGLVSLDAASAGHLSPNATEILQGRGHQAPTTEALQAAASKLAEIMGTDELVALLTAAFDDIPVACAVSSFANQAEVFAQASTFQAFTSPAEVITVLVPLGETYNDRLDYVRDSHEFPEFDSTGRSRWVVEGTASLPLVISGREQPIDSLDLVQGQLVVVGPGLIHRVVSSKVDLIFRVTFAPKRNTPIRFLAENTTWQEVSFGDGCRLRFA